MNFYHKSQRYFCTDENNRDLFFVALDSYDVESDYIFICSLDYDIEKIKGIPELVQELCLKRTTLERRTSLLQSLFKIIQTIPGIERKYFPTFLLDREGKFMENYLGTLRDILTVKVFPDYSAFSFEYNPVYFGFFLNVFSDLKSLGKLKDISQEVFVGLLPHNFVLQLLYVEHLSSSMEFFLYEERDGNEEYMDFYCLVSQGDLAFFFILRTQ